MKGAVKARRLRRQRGSLTREAVIETALALADAGGLEALTMPNLAQRLGCGVMTLYGYVDSKEDLLDAVAQRGIRDLELVRPVPDDIEGVLHAWGVALRGVLLEHTCLPVIFLSRPVVGSGIIRGVETLLGRLVRAGATPSAAARAIYAVLIYTTGFVAWEIPRTRTQPPQVYATSWRTQFAGLEVAEFPLTQRALGALAQVAGDEQYKLGLKSICAGLAARLGRIPRSPQITRE